MFVFFSVCLCASVCIRGRGGGGRGYMCVCMRVRARVRASVCIYTLYVRISVYVRTQCTFTIKYHTYTVPLALTIHQEIANVFLSLPSRIRRWRTFVYECINK